MGKTDQPRSIAPLAFVLFAFSGCSGLIYQSIWSHYLGLYLGHAAYAQSLVLAIFMGGMALGAWSVSRYGGDWRNLLRAYALIELVIGIAAAVFHPVYVGLTDFALETALPGLPHGWAGTSFKWASGTVLILPQAILLGATFPLMSNSLIRRDRHSAGAMLSTLYFTNSIGAAFGALFATFVLLPKIGLPGAMAVGAVINVLVALVAFVVSRTGEPRAEASERRAQGGTRPPFEFLLLSAAAITGATSFIYEIGWVRMLAMVLGSTTHAFELMLAAFIGGLAFGGLWIRRRIDGYADSIRVGGWVQVLMGLAALFSLLLYDHSFDWVAWFLSGLGRSDAGYAIYNVFSAAVAILIMVPAAFFAGMTLPLFTLSLIRAGGGEASVGRIYSANTLGAIVGVMLAVHLLIPQLGLKLAMVLAAAGDLVIGIVLLRVGAEAVPRKVYAYFAAMILSAISVAYVVRYARFDPGAMTVGVFRTGKARVSAEEAHVLFFRDGKTASIGVVEYPSGMRAISTNGKPDAGVQMYPDRPASPDESTMAIAALLPLASHPNPADVANIGFGSGLTTHYLLGDPRVKRVDTIEIEPAIYDGAQRFRPANDRAYSDPRAHIHFEDAKTYFASNASKYDVIVSEPSNPWVAGVATLFSREFYRFIPRHLKPGGLLIQWVQLYEIDEGLIATIANALDESFVDYRAYQSGTGDLLFVASADGMVPETNYPRLDAQTTRELSRLSMRTEDDLAYHLIGDRRTLSPLLRALSRKVNSDFYPVVSLEAPKARFRNLSAGYIDWVAIADIPMLEVLLRQPPPGAKLTASREFPRAKRGQSAVKIAQGMIERSDNAAADKVALAHQLFGACSTSGDTKLGLNVLRELAGLTIPYLDAAALKGVWIEPAWAGCTEGAADEATRLMFATLASQAARDWPGTYAGAVALLDKHRDAMDAATADYLLRLAMLAAIAQNDYADVAQLAVRFEEKSLPTDNFGFLNRVHLRAYADAEIERAAAATQAGARP